MKKLLTDVLLCVAFATERELLESLPFGTQCPEEEIELIRFLYENKLKKVRLRDPHKSLQNPAMQTSFILVGGGMPFRIDSLRSFQNRIRLAARFLCAISHGPAVYIGWIL